MRFSDSISILVVDDDEIDRMSIKRSFKKNDIKNPVFWATNGLEALELLRDPSTIPQPRIVLLDINMPKMNGLEFLEEIRRDEELKKLTAFVFTTSRHERDIMKAHSSQVAGYLVKPVSANDVREAVRTLKQLWEISEFPSNAPASKD